MAEDGKKFLMEPAKSGRGKCKKCKLVIEKGEIRMSKVSFLQTKKNH